jgi:hypothetical protein
VRALGLAAAAIAFGGAGPAAAVGPVPPDVCALVPGSAVAAAVGGRLSAERSVRPDSKTSRCVYRVAGRDGADRAFVVWWMPAADFEPLRAATDAPKPVQGVGDAAYAKYDGDTRRHGLVAVRRGVALVEVTGEDPAELRAIALLALSRYEGVK